MFFARRKTPQRALPSLSPAWFMGVLALLACCCSLSWAAPLPTTTTLTVSSSAGQVTTVPAQTVVTLTATVVGGVPGGQVTFCDASAAHCTDIHLLATAQVTPVGTATFRFIPGIGVHAYQAVYVGTKQNAASSSGVSQLTVTGSYPTTTTIQQSGTAGNYTLTATVVGTGSETLSLTGMAAFLDTSNSNESLGMAALGTSTVGLSFLNSENPKTGSGPYSVAVGDFNGDGIPDLATANLDEDSVTVLLGNGDGTFTQAPSISIGAGTSPISVAVGDFNGDGIPDLAVANFDGDSVTVLLGNGDGTLSAKNPGSQVGSGPRSVTVGDFNGDGIPDLATANYNDDNVTVLLGNGDGTFNRQPISPRVGSVPGSVAVGDFNGDGNADLATANASDDTVTVLLGNGDGTFSAKNSSLQVGTDPYSVAVGDFNGDGIPDLATTNGGDNTVTVLLGNGDGTFYAKDPSPQVGSRPYSVAVGDFNGDGFLDLATANSGANTVTVLLGHGDGTFTPQPNSPQVGDNPKSVAVGDFNGDGVPDLAAANSFSNTVTVLLTQLTQTAIASATGISPIGTGLHAVDANYPGSTNYSASTSGTVSLTATPVTTTLTLSTLPASSTYGQQVVLSATLTPSTAQGDKTDGEQVTFSSGSTTVGTGFLLSGTASINVTSLPVGTDSLTATYKGDVHFMTSTSSPVSFTVNAIAPNINFAVPNQTYGAAPFTVSASSYSSGSFTYTVVSGPATISGSTVTLTGAGTVVLQASQAAAGNYAAGSTTASFTVAPETTSINFSVPNQAYGAAPFTVRASSLSTGLFTYSVVSGPATISGSTVTLTGAGTVVLQASQAAAGNYAAGSTTASFTVNAASTQVTLQFAATTLIYPLPPTFEVTIAPLGKVPPTGWVTILDGSIVVGKYPLLKFTDGHVFGLVLPPLNVGQHSITAFYSGDQNYPSGTSAAVSITVTPGPVVLHATCGNLNLSAGQALSCQVLASEAVLPVNGTLNYALNGGPESNISLNHGKATITVANPPAGDDVLVLTYAAQGNYQAAPAVTVSFNAASQAKRCTQRMIVNQSTCTPRSASSLPGS